MIYKVKGKKIPRQSGGIYTLLRYARENCIGKSCCKVQDFISRNLLAKLNYGFICFKWLFSPLCLSNYCFHNILLLVQQFKKKNVNWDILDNF